MGVIYWQLKEGIYAGDITKECGGLLGTEIDSNFWFLRGNDIETLGFVQKEDGAIYLEAQKVNGDVVSFDATKVFDSYQFSVNPITRELCILKPSGEEIKLSNPIFSDASISGRGTAASPLRISSLEKAGKYKSVNGIITDGTLPSKGKYLHDRYILEETVNPVGRLYNSSAITTIQNMLSEVNSPWRIATEDDWNNLFTTVSCDGNFDKVGLVLKATSDERLDDSEEVWSAVYREIQEGEILDANTIRYEQVEENTYTESPDGNYIREINQEDTFHFSILPSDSELEYAQFWALDNKKQCFSFDTKGVVTEDATDDEYLSIRLVKDFNGGNKEDIEDILGIYYPTIVLDCPANNAEISDNLVWTASNLDLDVPGSILAENRMLANTKRYVIVDWNGESWDKKEMQEGDSCVVIEGTDIDSQKEYQLVHGKLVKIVDYIIQYVNANVGDGVAEKVSILEGKVNEIDEQITDVNDSLVDFKENLNTTNQNIVNLKNEVIHNEEAITASFTKIRDSLGLPDSLEYEGKADANYISDATSFAEADLKLDEVIRTLEDKITELTNKVKELEEYINTSGGTFETTVANIAKKAIINENTLIAIDPRNEILIDITPGENAKFGFAEDTIFG